MNKKGVISEYLPWLLIGLAVLSIVLIAIYFMKDSGVSLIDQVKDLFKGR